MTQMSGMQMPGRQRRRASGPDVYTALVLASCVALAVACAFVALAGMKIGPGGGPMGAVQIHPEGGPLDLGDTGR